MNSKNSNRDYSRATPTIVGSIVEFFSQSGIDLDDGVVRLIDHDEKCIWFGLFESDHQELDSKLALATWTVEISLEMKGAK